MKLHNSKTAFLLMLLEVYGVFSATSLPQSEPALDLQEILKPIRSIGKGEESPHGSFHFEPNPFLHSSGCRQPWILVGKTCLFTDLSKQTTWQGGRNFCKELHKGSDLAVFRDANEFAETLRHLRAINSPSKKVSFWIGGSDLEQNEEWLWITRQPMPMGSPFWGVSVSNGKYEPQVNDEHCAFLDVNNRHYMHDLNCGNKSISPLCQYNPFSF